MRPTSVMLFSLVIIVALVDPMPAFTQDANWTLPRTVDGYPDLQGVWANNNATPLERPPEWAGKAALTDEELAALQVAAAGVVDDGAVLNDRHRARP